MGDDPHRRAEEIAALRLGIELGLTLIDTAEMYGDGAAEELVGEASAGLRERVYLVSKVLPQHATASGTIAACERSLRRLGTDRLDLYLLHWRGDVPLTDTLEGFRALQQSGKIVAWGVSNFDVDDMDELRSLDSAQAVATDQVLYNLSRRGIEWELLPWCRRHRLPIMAYSPIEQGRLLAHPMLVSMAAERAVTPAQLALAWVLRDDNVIAIPKAGSPAHIRQNHAALDVALTPEDLAALDNAFPPPGRKAPLEML
jgi:diketogulonate reductase-like aldo/keto reductase